MKYSLVIGCPKCGNYRAKNTDNLVNINFKCVIESCGFSTVRKFKDRYGNLNFKMGFRKQGEQVSDCVARMNKGDKS